MYIAKYLYFRGNPTERARCEVTTVGNKDGDCDLWKPARVQPQHGGHRRLPGACGDLLQSQRQCREQASPHLLECPRGKDLFPAARPFGAGQARQEDVPGASRGVEESLQAEAAGLS